MSDQTYEGWTNWETWVTLSWIENDEKLYNRILSTTNECLRNKRPKSNLAFKLEQIVDGLIDDKILPDYQTGLVMDYIRRSISKVNFHEIADKYLDAVITCTEKKYLCGQCGDLVDKIVYNTELDVDECTDCETHFSEKHPKK